MAFVSIGNQPQANSINSTLLPITLTMSEATANTLNVIVQVWVWNSGGPWVEVGGKMRCASRFDLAGQFYINIEDICNPLTDAHLYTQNALQNCYEYGDDFISRTLTDWEYYGNRLVKCVVQREYLDATTGLIVVDPDETTSNSFTIHEGAQPNSMNFMNLMGNWDVYQLAYDSSYTSRGFLFYLTNAPRYRVPRSTIGGSFISEEYRYKLKTDEELILCGWFWEYFSAQKHKFTSKTYDVVGTLLNTRTVEIDGDDDGMQTMMVGPFAFFLQNTPIASEGNVAGSWFSEVSYYTLESASEKTSGGSYQNDIAAPIKVTIDRNCKGIGYKRFAWRNQLGGWDMFSSDGTYTERTDVKRDQFEKRIPTVTATSFTGDDSLWSYGKNNWNNVSEKKGTIVSQNLTQREAAWFANIGSSAQVYMKIFNNKYDPQPQFTYTEMFEDDHKCHYWVPIIITTKSIKSIKTNDKYVTVEFSFAYAVNERWGRL